uniref:Myb-like domain-containing protein n=1 Tax=Setaria viridis TaxID=4556 RepID=A0A4U6WCI6_SETVI|nr:hypothetical protein SEVIR_1G188700v2 [Setaria viridis]
MSQRFKRTSAPTLMEVPPPVAQSGQPAPPPSIPSMFGPGVWCPPRLPQSMPPSSAPSWLIGVQQPGMASSAAQGRWCWGLDSYPPGGFLNILKSRPQVASNGSSSQAIHIDDDNNDGNCSRTEKHLIWTKEEDLRLVSALVNNSNDPIQSNFKKNDQYWKGIAYVFNSTTLKNRVRTAKQIKDHFGRIKKRFAWFYDAYLERLDDLEPDKRKFSVDEDVGQHFSLDDARDERPIGGKKAKEQMKKRIKEQPCIINLEDELNNFLDAQKIENEGRKEMLETQRRVSTKEHKESIMLETYRALLIKETIRMPEDVKSEDVLALKCLREKLLIKMTKCLEFAMEFSGAGGARRGVWRRGCGGVAGDRAGVATEVITSESLEVIPPKSQEPEEVVTLDLEMEVVPDSQMEVMPDSITPELQMAPDCTTLNSIATVAEAVEAEFITTDSMPNLQMAPDSIAMDSIVPDSLPRGRFSLRSLRSCP